MSRPRAVTSANCEACRTVYTRTTPTAVEALMHRFEHLRADRRRAQWRRQKKRSRRADGRIGGLHSLRCQMPVRCTCQPIPVYASPEDAA